MGNLAGDHSLLPATGKLIVALSGGADSCALAHWVTEQADRSRVLLAHVNHGLRGAEADGDEAFCRAFAEKLGVPIAVHHADVAVLAKEQRESIEQCGRNVRYAFFGSLADGEDDRILTAHTADDNAETLLLNLTRGAGPDGLRGIPPVRGKVVRPFLCVTRQETEAYCAEYHIDYRTDSTNLSGEYARNRIRLEVLPVLKELNPRAVEALNRAAALQRQQQEQLHSAAETLLCRVRHPYGLDASELAAAPVLLRQAALKSWLESLCPGRIERRHIDLAENCLLTGGAVMLPGEIKLGRTQGVLWAVKKAEPTEFSLPVVTGETLLPNGKRLILQEIEIEQKIHNLLFKNAIDCAIIKNGLKIRTRRTGDRFKPPGRRITQPIKAAFQENKLPAALRAGALILECGGEIAWIEGIGASDRFRVTEQTQKMLKITVER